MKTLALTSAETLGTILVSILLILILSKPIIQKIKLLPSKAERRKELLETIKHCRTKLEYAFTTYSFNINNPQERAVRDRHSGLLKSPTDAFNFAELEILIDKISKAIAFYPEHIRKDALAQGEAKGNLTTIKTKKEKVSRRPTSISSNQKAVPIDPKKW